MKIISPRANLAALLALMCALICVTTLPAQEPAVAEPAPTAEANQANQANQAARAALAIGDAAPDFTLETFGEEKVTLSDHFGDEGHPVILLFSRANW